MYMGLKNKFGVLAGSVLIAGGVLTGAVFAAEAPEATTQPTQTEQSAKRSELTAGQKEVLQQLSDLRKSAMEKLQADSKAVIDQAAAEGKITQEQADKLLRRGGRGMGGFFGKRAPVAAEDLKARLDEAVKAGKMTQEQANKILERIDKMQAWSGKLREKHHMFRGGRHGG
jgi:polyhydroxyalkanoate synthesis regulator phasin